MAADPATTALIITAIGSAVSGAILAIAKLVEAFAYFRNGDDDDELRRRRHKRRRRQLPDDDDGPGDNGALLQARLA